MIESIRNPLGRMASPEEYLDDAEWDALAITSYPVSGPIYSALACWGVVTYAYENAEAWELIPQAEAEPLRRAIEAAEGPINPRDPWPALSK